MPRKGMCRKIFRHVDRKKTEAAGDQKTMNCLKKNQHMAGVAVYVCAVFAVLAIGVCFGTKHFGVIAAEKADQIQGENASRPLKIQDKKQVSVATFAQSDTAPGAMSAAHETMKMTLCVPVSSAYGMYVGKWLDMYRDKPVDIRLYGNGERELALALILRSALLRNESSGRILLSHIMSIPVLERDPQRILIEMASSPETHKAAQEIRAIAAKQETQNMIVDDAKWCLEHVGNLADFAVFLDERRVPMEMLGDPASIGIDKIEQVLSGMRNQAQGKIGESK